MVDKLSGTKAHTRYCTSDGKTVPGTTTVTGLLNKPQLVIWANRLGLEGIDSTKYRDKTANIGTCAHLMVQNYLAGVEQPDYSLFSQDDISQAENALLSFWEWEKTHKIEPLMLEQPMVSELYRYGGTVDCVAKMDDKIWLIDFKTGKAIYDEMAIQLAAYRNLLDANGIHVDGCRILRIGRSDDEGFDDKIFDNLDKNWEIFYHLLQVYHLKQEVKPERNRKKI